MYTTALAATAANGRRQGLGQYATAAAVIASMAVALLKVRQRFSSALGVFVTFCEGRRLAYEALRHFHHAATYNGSSSVRFIPMPVSARYSMLSSIAIQRQKTSAYETLDVGHFRRGRERFYKAPTVPVAVAAAKIGSISVTQFGYVCYYFSSISPHHQL